ncbi:dephospho-CoA kinase [Nitratifractor salsuginis]|uniref:Dephospho-CoA kinase n=1 Tax=Nitratifractor salsuginis (strain DSM 16511 / JCM 12458 / E9I37-1) TaxID=749222 RepID=E6WXY4_NITSE|nr:dephospho-CoA kinase [Nitratifractor salsuginis]ADV45305.1 dephospho-CoA kinase [Nitratifractor salsuginis DSM 16511]
MAYEHAVILTGGIATGKSTATALLQLYGFRVIDADAIAHEMLDRHADEVVKRFGAEFLTEGGKIDRKALGAHIFAHPEERKALEAILHPPIREEILRRSEEQERLGKPYLIDIPLFFESGEYPIEKSVVVYTPKEIQLRRLMERDGFSEEEAKRRIDAQLDIEEKRKRATWVIDNSGDLKQLSRECERVKEGILKTFE